MRFHAAWCAQQYLYLLSSAPKGGLQQSQQLGHAAFLNYYGGNVIYPMYHGYSMPGFSAPSVSQLPPSPFPSLSP